MDYARAAAYIGCSERTLRAAKAKGLIHGMKIGREIRFTQAQLDAFIQRVAQEKP